MTCAKNTYINIYVYVSKYYVHEYIIQKEKDEANVTEY